MTTKWIHRLFIFVPAGETENANAGHTLYWPEGEGERLTFAVPLSADGAPPVTHYGTNTAGTALLSDTYRDLLNSISPNAIWYLLDMDGDFLLATNGAAEIGIGFSWDLALADMGLMLIQGDG
jgi:hypothetical protein